VCDLWPNGKADIKAEGFQYNHYLLITHIVIEFFYKYISLIKEGKRMILAAAAAIVL
jgi:hypothetical protein